MVIVESFVVRTTSRSTLVDDASSSSGDSLSSEAAQNFFLSTYVTDILPLVVKPCIVPDKKAPVRNNQVPIYRRKDHSSTVAYFFSASTLCLAGFCSFLSHQIALQNLFFFYMLMLPVQQIGSASSFTCFREWHEHARGPTTIRRC